MLKTDKFTYSDFVSKVYEVYISIIYGYSFIGLFYLRLVLKRCENSA